METKHTPGPWQFRPWMHTDVELAELKSHGLEPVPATNNDGARFIMAGSGEGLQRVALVDCQSPRKRGQGHRTECAERDANARLIAAAPDYDAAGREVVAAWDIEEDAPTRSSRARLIAAIEALRTIIIRATGDA